GGVAVDGGAGAWQVPAASAHLGPALGVLPQSAQQLTLLAGGDQCLVDLGEVVEVGQGLVGQLEGAGDVEHVVAQQGVDIAQLLGGLDLVQQPQGLLVGDAQQLAEGRAVLTELAEGLGAGMGGLKRLASIWVETKGRRSATSIGLRAMTYRDFTSESELWPACSSSRRESWTVPPNPSE